jgi:hypothetical protein
MKSTAQRIASRPKGLSALSLIRSSFHHTRPLHRPSR